MVVYIINDEGTETQLDVSGSGNIIQTITIRFYPMKLLSYSLPNEKSITAVGAKVTSAFAATTDIEVKNGNDKRIFFGRILADTPGRQVRHSYMNLTGSSETLKLVVSGRWWCMVY